MSDAIAGKTMLLTGANRGLGRALVEEALHRGVARVNAASRRPATESAGAVVNVISLDGVARGEEEIFPDPMALALAEGWRAGVVKEFERQNATMVQTAISLAPAAA